MFTTLPFSQCKVPTIWRLLIAIIYQKKFPQSEERKIEEYLSLEKIANSKFLLLDEKCHVLPSLKKASIVSVSKFPGYTSYFKNYSELQNHWKNMYGYILPNMPEEDIWYFNVVFNIPNAKPYTYPQFCVKPCGMILIPRVDPRPILSSFLKAFCKSVGNICGEKCKLLEGRASFTTLELFPACKVSEDMKPRAGTTYVMKSNAQCRKDIPFVSAGVFKPTTNGQTKCTHVVNSNCIKENIVKESQPDLKPTKSERDTENHNPHTPVGVLSYLPKPQTIIAPLKETTFVPTPKTDVSSLNVENTAPQQKYAPIFRPIARKKITLSSAQSLIKSQLYAPTFLPKHKKFKF